MLNKRQEELWQQSRISFFIFFRQENIMQLCLGLIPVWADPPAEGHSGRGPRRLS